MLVSIYPYVNIFLRKLGALIWTSKGLVRWLVAWSNHVEDGENNEQSLSPVVKLVPTDYVDVIEDSVPNKIWTDQ